MTAKETAPKDEDKTHKTTDSNEARDAQAPPADGDELPIPTEVQK